MHITRLDRAPAYDAPGHQQMRMLRLQSRESGPADQLWLGLSYLLPGGGTTLDASDIEKMYVVLEGEVAVSDGVCSAGGIPAASHRASRGSFATARTGQPRSCSPCPSARRHLDASLRLSSGGLRAVRKLRRLDSRPHGKEPTE